MERVCIDGSFGEGGGQIVRTALSLACITGKAVRIENIRANRPNAGLARQHLVCVQAAAEICGGRCKGGQLHSQQLDFEPARIQSGDYHFDIGSAGSASLVMQTVLPVLFCSDKKSTVTVTGGTHNPWAPPYDFLKETFFPVIESAGFVADCRLLRHGFYPAGGGRMALEIQPRRDTDAKAVELCLPPGEAAVSARIYTAHLPAHIAQRQCKLLQKCGLGISKIEHIDVADSDSAGNCVVICVCAGDRTTVFTGFGSKGKPSDKVIAEAAEAAGDFMRSSAAVDGHLADQLLLYMAMRGAGRFTTNEVSMHLTTNIEVIRRFMPVDFAVRKSDGEIFHVECGRL